MYPRKSRSIQTLSKVATARSVSLVALIVAASSLIGCNEATTPSEEGARVDQALEQDSLIDSCGYDVTAKYHSRWQREGYYGLFELTNVSGETAKDYEVFADLGGAEISLCLLSEYKKVEGGYLFTAPKRFEKLGIRRGHTYPFFYMTRDPYATFTPYIISINGIKCDQVAPTISLESSGSFYTSTGALTLTATASDNVAVKKVVFLRDGKEIGTDTTAPYSLDVTIDASSNGRGHYTAVAYDISGNSTTSNSKSVLSAIGNKFFGTAADVAVDYSKLLTYFNQVTPGNAGKWGTVEATRDVMDWTNLDTAYQFAQSNGLPFKLHTLIWGSQQPSWLTALTPAEQLVEIEQWMAAAAARYPNVALVDVVNEPLHAVPAYKEALGGNGTTGWDWVLKSFELARKYFPNAELLVNDYNVEAMESWATDYLQIINLLKGKGLVDGIGLQAHFLERVELSVIAANLDRYAATGLPIYVSELDVNFANDSRQAQRMRDLFTLFWNHPSVVGVTHWGYLQGSMWRTDSYLLRSDGSARPAMDWLTCFRAGGTNCTVPDYVATPRTGDKTSITLEAEDYDNAQGLMSAGNVVAYTDNGDWMSFDRVTFDNNWDSLSVTYAKGNTDAANLTIHLDSLDSAPVTTVQLPTSGGWGTSKTVTMPWLAIAGEHKVYVKFNGGSGVANVDNVKFAAPVGVGANLLTNGGFETNTNGWYTWSGTLALNNKLAASGSQSLQVTNRTGNAPAATTVTPLVLPGKTYKVELWTTVTGAATSSVKVTRKVTCNGTTSYTQFVNPVTVTEGQWSQLSGDLVVPDCANSEVTFYAEGPDAGIDMYIDHVSMRQVAAANIVSNGTFESGTSGWSTWSGSLSATTARAHSGTKSLLVSPRTGNAPAATNLTNVVTPGASYQVSFWTTIGGAASDSVKLTQKTQCQGQSATYAQIANPITVTDGVWSELKATMNVPNCALTELTIYAEGPAAGVDLYVDDVNIWVPSNILPDGTFESGIGGWFTWSGTLATTTTISHGGSQAAVLTNRTGNGPIARSLIGLAQPGKTYAVSLWATIGNTTSPANVNITRKLTCDGTTSYSWVGGQVSVTPGVWSMLGGTMALPACTNMTDLLIYAEGPGAGIDLYVDDVTVAQ
jgi:GH35 family endo-1,4-beta-xylanase